MEKRKFEKLLGMGSGYVLQFSNRTFEEFVTDSTGREIYDQRYAYGSGSKANRLRAFWQVEPSRVVAKLMGDMLDLGVEDGLFKDNVSLLEECRRIVTRLLQESPVPELEALTAITDEKDFEGVRSLIEPSMDHARHTLEDAHARYGEVYKDSLVGLSACQCDGEECIETVPLLLDWDDIRITLQQKNGRLINLAKRYVTSKSRKEQ
jgi:hypothetical protein